MKVKFKVALHLSGLTTLKDVVFASVYKTENKILILLIIS